MTAPFPVGARLVDDTHTRFTVWAPERRRVSVSRPGSDGAVDLSPLGQGYHGAVLERCPAGARYQFLLDGEGPFADPASRSQPEGVHGPSEVVDLAAHRWTDAAHRPRP